MVAGREFLDAYFTHGDWQELTAIVYNQASAQSLARLHEQHPCRRGRPLRLAPMAAFPGCLFPVPPALCRRLGAAGRQRVLERFTWAGVIRSYEDLWRGQEAERQARAARSPVAPPRGGPPCYPSPEWSFADYPTFLLDKDDLLEAAAGAGDDLGQLLALPLTSYAGDRRLNDEAALRAVLAAASTPRTVSELDACLDGRGASYGAGRATLAWMLKYGLLRRVRAPTARDG